MAQHITDPCFLSLLTPNGVEELKAGDSYAITWLTYKYISDMIIEYSTNDGENWQEVNPPNTGNTGSYDWIIPDVGSKKCFVRIKDSARTTVCDMNDRPFTIKPYMMGYISTYTSNSIVYSTNFDTGEQTPIGPTGIRNIESIEFLPENGHLYGTGTDGSFYEIDTTTGSASLIRTGLHMHNLAFAPDGTLYGTNFDELYMIDVSTGNATLVGSLSPYVSTFAFAIDGSGKGIAWDVGANWLFEIDLTNASTTSIGYLNGDFHSFDYDPDGTLYGWGNNNLYRIDPCTLEVIPLQVFDFGGEGFAIIPESINSPPEVDAGPDQKIRPPGNSIKLEGVVTDDGLPEGGELSIIWSVESGPGTVTFDPNEFILDPCVIFAMPGAYTLRLTANDGELEGHDEVVITYNYDHIYVDIDAAGSNNGTSWGDAFNYLQDALAIADFSVEIRVAQGIYKPDQGVGITPGDREASFQLASGVIIRGGYAGFAAIDPDARNVETYQTILSGDLNGDDGPNFENNSENSYQVVTSTKNNMTAVLDGFTITGGNANGLHPYNLGGGMYNFSGSPTLLNCTFTCNWATHGGGMYNYYSKPILSHCIFSKNSAQGYGGGMRNSRGIPMLTNCTFYGNSANRGGGICDYQNTSRPLLVNCILWGNKDSSGTGETAQISGETSYICYSCVQGLIGSDPLFADPNNGDYHLQSQAGRWEPASQSWVQDNVTSPCIDTGNPLTDCSAELSPNGSRINMGAYGGTAQASMSPSDLYNVADLNNDGIVNLLDFAIFAENWLWEAS